MAQDMDVSAPEPRDDPEARSEFSVPATRKAYQFRTEEGVISEVVCKHYFPFQLSLVQNGPVEPGYWPRPSQISYGCLTLCTDQFAAPEDFAPLFAPTVTSASFSPITVQHAEEPYGAALVLSFEHGVTIRVCSGNPEDLAKVTAKILITGILKNKALAMIGYSTKGYPLDTDDARMMGYALEESGVRYASFMGLDAECTRWLLRRAQLTQLAYVSLLGTDECGDVDVRTACAVLASPISVFSAYGQLPVLVYFERNAPSTCLHTLCLVARDALGSKAHESVVMRNRQNMVALFAAEPSYAAAGSLWRGEISLATSIIHENRAYSLVEWARRTGAEDAVEYLRHMRLH